MKRSLFVVLVVCAELAALLIVAASAGAGPAAAPAEPLAPQVGAPPVVSYQGQVTVNGLSYTGDGYFKFAVVDELGATNYWANDGTASGEPAAAVIRYVAGGLFNVLLGEDMTALPPSAFAGTDRYLRVWFSSDGIEFQQLSPDRRIAAAPYALQAAEAGNAGTLDGVPASAFQLRVSGVCEGGSTISAINEDGTVVCQGLPVEQAVPVGSVQFTSPALDLALVSFSLDATHICVPNQSCPPTVYHLTLVHELDNISPLFFERTALGNSLGGFTLFVEHPITTLDYLRLDADEVSVTSVATETQGRPGGRPLETITLSFESLNNPLWTTTGADIPIPEDFPLLAQVGTLTLGSVTVPVFGHEWSTNAGTTSPSFSSLVVTTPLDGSAPQIQIWLDSAATLSSAQLDLFTPGAKNVMATYELMDANITGVEQWASGAAGELAFSKVTLTYARITETVGEATFCWDLATNSECN